MKNGGQYGFYAGGRREERKTDGREDWIAILPPTPGACPYCGDTHDPNSPHNRDSLIYQHKFRAANGRYPTWADAMQHCSALTKAKWTEELRRRGIWVEGEKTDGK